MRLAIPGPSSTPCWRAARRIASTTRAMRCRSRRARCPCSNAPPACRSWPCPSLRAMRRGRSRWWASRCRNRASMWWRSPRRCWASRCWASARRCTCAPRRWLPTWACISSWAAVPAMKTMAAAAGWPGSPRWTTASRLPMPPWRCATAAAACWAKAVPTPAAWRALPGWRPRPKAPATRTGCRAISSRPASASAIRRRAARPTWPS
ncbi:hypothetical protein D9M72_243850 [compost metagenome]